MDPDQAAQLASDAAEAVSAAASPLGWRLAVMAAALLCSFFFSASEFAVIRLDRLKIKEEAENGSQQAKTLSAFLSDTGRFLSSLSVGNTVANLLLGSFAAVTFAPPIAAWLVRRLPGSPDLGLVESCATAILTLALSYAVLVCGEIAPKQFAIARGDAFARRAAGPLRAWGRIVAPAVFLVNGGVKALFRLFGARVKETEAATVTEEQILRQVEYGEEHGSIEADEKEMIENVFAFNDLTAEDVMVHRKDVVALPIDASVREIRDTIRTSGYSRLPVYEGSIDEIEGVLNARDWLLRASSGTTPKLGPLLRKPLFVPETVKADVLFKRMQKRKAAMAIVVDDHGGTSGIITMEDLVEQVVGDIYDEYDSDEEEVKIAELGPGRWRVPGEALLGDVNDELGTELEEGEYGTLGGWLFERLESVPSRGAVADVPEQGLRMVVEKMDGHRIDSVLVEKTGPAAPENKEQCD
ncbi:MAG: HlyC/CorC family transporter [Kiritimatiellae bacterium]|nr:HlyC/CorC family transporter [Kiritimatiellia bacterium]